MIKLLWFYDDHEAGLEPRTALGAPGPQCTCRNIEFSFHLSLVVKSYVFVLDTPALKEGQTKYCLRYGVLSLVIPQALLCHKCQKCSVRVGKDPQYSDSYYCGSAITVENLKKCIYLST